MDYRNLFMSMIAMIGSRKVIAEVQDELDAVLDHPSMKVIILFSIIEMVIKNWHTSLKLTFVIISFWAFYKYVFIKEPYSVNVEAKENIIKTN